MTKRHITLTVSEKDYAIIHIGSGKHKFISTKSDAWMLDPFTGSSTTGIAASLANRRFLGIYREESFLVISKNRRLEIENIKTSTAYKQKADGYKDKKELELF